MRAALLAFLALCLLGLSGCTSDPANPRNSGGLGVSPGIPSQIHGGSGWR